MAIKKGERIVICSRIGDPLYVPVPGSIVIHCDECFHEINISPATNEVRLAEKLKVVCMQCAAHHADTTGQKIARQVIPKQREEIEKFQKPVIYTCKTCGFAHNSPRYENAKGIKQYTTPNSPAICGGCGEIQVLTEVGDHLEGIAMPDSELAILRAKLKSIGGSDDNVMRPGVDFVCTCGKVNAVFPAIVRQADQFVCMRCGMIGLAWIENQVVRTKIASDDDIRRLQADKSTWAVIVRMQKRARMH